MASNSIDYAAASGFHSLAAAVIFAILYFPFFLWFIRQSLKNTTYVYIVLTLFCAMRIVAFILRAILLDTAQGSNLGLFIADQILFGVGFFALLYSAYTLVLDRDIIAGGKPVGPFSFKLMQNPHLFRLALMVGVVVGIVGTIDLTSSDADSRSSGQTLRKASIVIFLVLTVLQAVQAAVFFPEQSYSKDNRRQFGDRHGRYLLLIISLLLLVREVFTTANINDTTKQNDERLWYPLVVLPEYLAVVCYAISGLVPTRAALKEAQR